MSSRSALYVEGPRGGITAETDESPTALEALQGTAARLYGFIRAGPD